MEAINSQYANHLIQQSSRPDRCNLAVCGNKVVCKGNWDPLCRKTLYAQNAPDGLVFPFKLMVFGSDGMGYNPCPFFKKLSPEVQNQVRDRLEIIE